jgi:hypothetical protein
MAQVVSCELGLIEAGAVTFFRATMDRFSGAPSIARVRLADAVLVIDTVESDEPTVRPATSWELDWLNVLEFKQPRDKGPTGA